MNKRKKYRLVALDLDGTLTQHRSPLEPHCRQILESLQQKFKLVMVCAGGCERVRRQLGGLEIDILGYYGIQASVAADGFQIKPAGFVRPPDKDGILNCVAGLRKRFGFLDYAGESAEFHDSGVVTFPLLGQRAALDQKLIFDPDRAVRRKIYADVVAAFPDYNVFIGGSSSFDLVPKPYDKYHALEGYLSRVEVSPDEVIYFGDDFGFGGNDSPIGSSDLDCVVVDDYRSFPTLAHDRLLS
ncbi:HAD hydrolase family protein [Castellaniella hirudinis]|uniref:HAD hydrolase family protein n=1 Tax=Castellaniella hirudinis TaxID=1144617 RepID=UPI0039C213C7